MITKFGKTAVLKISGNDSFLLSTEGLRIDFDVRMLQGFNRAKFDIYNLSPKTISQLSEGDKYVTLEVSLHGGPVEVLIDNMYVNNSVTEKRVPNTITSLYCVDSLRKDVTSKHISTEISKPSLINIQSKIATDASKLSTKGGLKFYNHDFPEGWLTTEPLMPTRTYTGEVGDIINELGEQYSFASHIKGNVVECAYVPKSYNIHLSGQVDRGTIMLDTNNMRSNPIIGMATLQIESNLDTRIEGNSLLDTSNLVTASTEDGFDVLTIVKDHLKSNVSGYARFLVLSVQHIGSTHTNSWSTKALATRATDGVKVAQYNWFGKE